ncbi:HAD hydrolase family protein [Calidifontibacter sp. DB0510]|uniref:HAD hydrolase family protein n=1 Tax=Metallococcus carri TaxID=1656884 RepID=A0A967B4Q0_9MICO|nr:HAD hydrolase family protein [Metallococcus carri]NOP37962.1 HAD hydrolase family protein [Calidifontibacter sp. DB2511S]
MVALDIDGTTIHHDGHLSDRVRAAVQAARDAGHQIVIATGRSVLGTLPVCAELGLTDGYAVCSNGAVTLALDPTVPQGYRIEDVVTFDPRPVLARLRNAWDDGLVAVEVLGSHYKISAPFPEGELPGPTEVVSWEELGTEPTTRLTFRSPTGTADDFVELAEGLGLHGMNYAVGFTAWMDINPDGISKASALEQIRARLGVPIENVVAVGDHRNDVQMLQWAGRGVAMGQAPEEVKAVADEVTAPVEEDGLALVLEGLV